MALLEKYEKANNEIGESGLEIIPPKGFSFEKFDSGRKFMQENIVPITFGMFISLVSGLSIHNLLEPLVFTRQSDSPEKAFRRYESTFVQVCRWCYGNIWDKSDIGYRSIRRVRDMHNKVRESLMRYECKNGKFGDKQTSYGTHPAMRVSQYEMSLVQSGFFGPVVINPSFLGIRYTEKDLDDFVYFWYGVGYALGITDQNNICYEGYEHAKKVCLEISHDILLPALQNPPKDFDKMAKFVCDGANIPLKFPFNNFFSKDSLVALGLNGLGEKVPNLSLPDYIRFYILKLWICVVYYFPSYNRFISKIFKKIYWESPVMYKKYKV